MDLRPPNGVQDRGNPKKTETVSFFFSSLRNENKRDRAFRLVFLSKFESTLDMGPSMKMATKKWRQILTDGPLARMWHCPMATPIASHGQWVNGSMGQWDIGTLSNNDQGIYGHLIHGIIDTLLACLLAQWSPHCPETADRSTKLY